VVHHGDNCSCYVPAVYTCCNGEGHADEVQEALGVPQSLQEVALELGEASRLQLVVEPRESPHFGQVVIQATKQNQN
jgi:hypothetical protein